MEPTETFTFEGRDGVAITGYSWKPQSMESCCGIVQVAHGMAEHALRYGRFAKHLNDAGYLVYANDHRGHGKTGENQKAMGFFAEKDGWSLVVDDMYALHQNIRKEYPSLPIFLFGHSMGSFLSQQYISQYGDDLAGTILSASVDNAGFLRGIGAMVARIERKRLGAQGKSALLTAMSFGDFNKAFKPNRTEYDWLSRDEEEVDKYIADPLCGFMVTTQLWIDLLGGLGEMAKEETRQRVPDKLPLLLLTGSEDPVTKQGKAVDGLEKAYKKAGITDITVKKYQGGRHESLNEINREEVTTDIVEWLKAHTK